MPTEPITDQDLALYVDDQLEPKRRIAVEAHLAREPALAARVMEDLRISHALRLTAASDTDQPNPRTSELARKLQSAMLRRAVLHRLRPSMAACVLLVSGAVLGGAVTGLMSKPGVPDYVEVALQAHAVSQVRAVMISQPESPDYDRDELLSATAIVMPTLPDDWVVTDVQVYPSRFGPSVEMAIDAGELGRASIFAARPGDFAVIAPSTSQHEQSAFGHWQMGEIAYVLVGRAEPAEILHAAEALASTLY
ncbi:Transmembrane transcriptional regulator (anti-sigma factor RsiW) [Devosia lucknowensis]|uniref:Transmembrane transcriptional regulator (Anti-sigma factor RsiW) n=1 Tax=Devosia lucknowensis TaxID=1096929 RepID=A0A1Y6F5A9_9HYPH|nr:anti-sigma factor [Devosia lucknowensis]SMQ68731.1 Transmembrane transcriptional regulator (anti-sigma factor RsiW) [Devosia lucknowensis]